MRSFILYFFKRCFDCTCNCRTFENKKRLFKGIWDQYIIINENFLSVQDFYIAQCTGDFFNFTNNRDPVNLDMFENSQTQ